MYIQGEGVLVSLLHHHGSMEHIGTMRWTSNLFRRKEFVLSKIGREVDRSQEVPTYIRNGPYDGCTERPRTMSDPVASFWKWYY
jgi:hypothetical protein